MVDNLTVLQVQLIDMRRDWHWSLGGISRSLLFLLLLADHHASWEKMRGQTYDRGEGEGEGVSRLTRSPEAKYRAVTC